MVSFIDREHELDSLGELWNGRFQLVMLWGRRRIGKTRLIQQFARGKPTMYFQADEGTAVEQLGRLTESLLAYQDDPLLRAQPLANWDAGVSALLKLGREARQGGRAVMVVLDEFPRLVVTSPRLPSLLQGTVDEMQREDLPMVLVLCGSQIGLFERHVLHGPLYGRRTWGQQLPPLGHRQAGDFFPSWSPTDRMRAWALLGGIPYYLEQWDAGRSLGWNIRNRLLRKGAVLYDEAELVIKEELGSEAGTYRSILAAVAGGETRQSGVASRVGIDSSAAGRYLSQLSRLHMVEHRYPLGAGDRSRRGIWHLADHYLRAWFAFVRANRSDLEVRRIDEVYRTRVHPSLDAFVARPAFEDAARTHALESVGHDPAFPAAATVGAWWGPIPDDRQPGSRRTREAELDIVGYEDKRLVLAGEAKWSVAPEDGSALAQLRRTVVHAPGYDPDGTRLAIYSRAGFTERFREQAARGRIILRSLESLYG